MELPQSCDTFVALPPLTKHGVIFGKNSDRPKGEVQEVVYFPASQCSNVIKCTYIEVEYSGPRKAVILSKPSWMWGAEMGANECGVVIGNEAVWTNNTNGENDPSVKRLLGMDLVRLGLEQSSSATEALEIITNLLEKYGQGGPCAEEDSGLSYHNSFLIADSSTAWILETSGKQWVAEQISSGCRNISNGLSITTKFDRHSKDLFDYAKAQGFWNGEDEFNFSEVFGGEKVPGSDRYIEGQKLLKKYTETNDFKEVDMFNILRDRQSGICRPCDSPFPTQGSQVSVLSSTRPSVHWFTATPDPSISVYKPFIFTPNAIISKHTICPEERKNSPHTLYTLHERTAEKGDEQVQKLLRNMEENCVKELNDVIENIGDNLAEMDELMKDCVETEVKFYR
ncbi:secernin-3-like isoform X2 [Agrilus planipennis]|nr:secernin-3-like isoform X2 [Agrilus planipennis]